MKTKLDMPRLTPCWCWGKKVIYQAEVQLESPCVLGVFTFEGNTIVVVERSLTKLECGASLMKVCGIALCNGGRVFCRERVCSG